MTIQINRNLYLQLVKKIKKSAIYQALVCSIACDTVRLFKAEWMRNAAVHWCQKGAQLICSLTHSLAPHLPPSPVSLLSKLSFCSLLLAFTLFLWEDHRLFLLRLQSSALQERRDRETSSSVSSVLSLVLRSRELRLWFSRVDAFSDAVKPGRETRAVVRFTSWMWTGEHGGALRKQRSVFAWRTCQSVSIQSRK